MAESFYYNLKKKVVDFVANTKIYPYPGFILFSDASYKVKGPLMREVIDALQPGDILLRMYDHYVGSYFIPGYWTHSAHFEGPNNVIHMLGEGIVEEDILTFLRCDDVCVLRSNKGIESVQNAVVEARKKLDEGIKYDYHASLTSKDYMYCTEFTNHIHELGLDDSKIIMPDQLPNHPSLDIIVPGRKG